MSSRARRRLQLLLVVLLLVPAVAQAGRVDEIRARGKLIVSVKNDARHEHKDPAHAQKRGFEVELVHAIAERLLGDASRVELRLLARPVRLPMLAAGAVDLVVSMIPMTAENARQCQLSHPYFSSGLSLLMPEKAKPLRLDELAGKTIAFRKQSFNDHGAELRRLAAARSIALQVRYYASFDEAVQAVVKGEAAAMGGNFVDLDAWRKTHAGYAVDTTLLEERPVAVAVAKGADDLLELVNATIDGLKRTGQLQRMTEKWRLPYLLPPG